MERRAFILAFGSACGLLSGIVTGCTGFRYVPHTREGRLLAVRRSDFGEGPYAMLDDPLLPRAIFLHRRPDETFAAVMTRCSHLGCQVEPAGDRLVCPCHGSEYEWTGELLQGPAERPLDRYRVTADDEMIYIELPDQP